MFSILKPFIFTLDPEVAHDLAINSLKLNVLPKNLFKVDDEELLETKLFNQSLPHGNVVNLENETNLVMVSWKLAR